MRSSGRLPARAALPSDLPVRRLKAMCFSKCPLAEDKELLKAIDARQQSIDIMQPHGNVRILTLPYEHIPGELNKLCGCTAIKRYSKNGILRHMDVFGHIYVARELLPINDTINSSIPSTAILLGDLLHPQAHEQSSDLLFCLRLAPRTLLSAIRNPY